MIRIFLLLFALRYGKRSFGMKLGYIGNVFINIRLKRPPANFAIEDNKFRLNLVNPQEAAIAWSCANICICNDACNLY